MDLLAVFFRATPWALPLTGLSGVLIAFLARRLGAWLGVPRLLAWFFLTSCTGFLAVTITPSRDASFLGSPGHYFSMSWQLLGPSRLFSLNSDALNVWLYVPVGIFGGLCYLSGKRGSPLATLVLLPLISEMVQFVVPELGRSAFLMSDVANNWVGGAVGVVIALGLRLTWRRAEATLSSGGPPRISSGHSVMTRRRAR